MEFGINKKYNIVILTASHPHKVSGIIAFDLKECLSELGHNVIIITNSKLEKNYTSTYTITSKFSFFINKVINKFNNLLRFRSNEDYYMYGLYERKSISRAKKILNKIEFNPDAFIYLFPQFFLGSSDLAYLHKKTNAPIFWYLMDMAAMTGGCHYSNNCFQYTNECGQCPGIYSQNIKDITYHNWKIKYDFINSNNIIPIAGSDWLLNQLKLSSIFKNKSHYKIYLPINNSIFQPGNKFEVRKKLGLPQDLKLIFFGAVSVYENRKGYKELINSLELLKTYISDTELSKIHLIIAGNNEQIVNELPFNHTFLGFLDHSKLANVFQAADVFLCPSIEDSGPMMINQSIMCGTPVVSFEVGVSLDLVHTDKTGYRAKFRDCNDFAYGLKKILELSTIDKQKMDVNCIELSRNELKLSVIGSKFNEMFNEVIK